MESNTTPAGEIHLGSSAFEHASNRGQPVDINCSLKEDANNGRCTSGSAVAIWTEDIILDPGNIRYPIRVVLVDDQFHTQFDRLVQLPKNSTTYIYRVLDHGIPWQHLQAGLTIEEVKTQILTLCKGKELVVYDVVKLIELFHLTQQDLSEGTVFDVKYSRKSMGPNGQPLPYWDLVRTKIQHNYTGKPGNYDATELTDFLMSIYLSYKKNDSTDTNVTEPKDT